MGLKEDVLQKVDLVEYVENGEALEVGGGLCRVLPLSCGKVGVVPVFAGAAKIQMFRM